MKIQVSGKGFELAQDLRNDVEEKVGMGLDRFTERIRRVNVFLEDVNGPKRGFDKSLRMIVDIDRLPLIVVEEKGEVWISLVDKAVQRSAHTVRRQIDRIRTYSNRTSMSGDEEASQIRDDDQLEGNPLRFRHWRLPD
jgi:ribosome-associated translation inhibitor RaiA